jgi:hypothetical protein
MNKLLLDATNPNVSLLLDILELLLDNENKVITRSRFFSIFSPWSEENKSIGLYLDHAVANNILFVEGDEYRLSNLIMHDLEQRTITLERGGWAPASRSILIHHLLNVILPNINLDISTPTYKEQNHLIDLDPSIKDNAQFDPERRLFFISGCFIPHAGGNEFIKVPSIVRLLTLLWCCGEQDGKGNTIVSTNQLIRKHKSLFGYDVSKIGDRESLNYLQSLLILSISEKENKSGHNCWLDISYAKNIDRKGILGLSHIKLNKEKLNKEKGPYGLIDSITIRRIL